MKINIATPSYGSRYSGEYVRSLYALIYAGIRNDVIFSLSDIDYAEISVSRNYLISNFYFNKADATHILFIDDDMGFEPDLIFKMIAAKSDVTGVFAPKRNISLGRLHGAKDMSFEQALRHASDFVGDPEKPLVRKGDFIKARSCGTGIMLISRQAVNIMIEKCPDIVDEKRFRKMPFGAKFSKFLRPFDRISTPDADYSEDLSFCHRWTKQCGGEIWANDQAVVRHVGTMVYSGKYAT